MIPQVTDELFKGLFDHTSIGMIITNSDGIIEQANSYSCKLFGYELSDLLGSKVEALLPVNLRAQHENHRNDYIKNPTHRAMGLNRDLIASKKDGSQFPVEVSLSYYHFQGELKIVSVIIDITKKVEVQENSEKQKQLLERKVEERTIELQNALKKQEELNDLKTRFVSMASHEFRTPLASILTSISLVKRYTNEITPSEATDNLNRHIGKIKYQIEHLTSILNDFLSIEKIDTDQLAPKPTHFNLIEVLNNEIDLAKDSDNFEHSFKLNTSKDELTVFQDKNFISSIISNLISNAIKYSPSKTEIILEVEESEKTFKISVQDFGIGVPLEDQKYLSNRFFRAENATTIKGSGLGLSIINKYLEFIGGEMNFKSTLNKGSTFEITAARELS